VTLKKGYKPSDGVREVLSNALFALQDAWPYVHGGTIDSIKKRVRTSMGELHDELRPDASEEYKLVLDPSEKDLRPFLKTTAETLKEENAKLKAQIASLEMKSKATVESRKISDSLTLEIAKEFAPSVSTMDTQNSDSLDFHDVSISGIKQMIERAHAEGFASGSAEKIENDLDSDLGMT